MICHFSSSAKLGNLRDWGIFVQNYKKNGTCQRVFLKFSLGYHDYKSPSLSFPLFSKIANVWKMEDFPKFMLSDFNDSASGDDELLPSQIHLPAPVVQRLPQKLKFPAHPSTATRKLWESFNSDSEIMFILYSGEGRGGIIQNIGLVKSIKEFQLYIM